MSIAISVAEWATITIHRMRPESWNAKCFAA